MYAAERRRKRAAFLRNVSLLLGLSNYTVLESDVRHLQGSYGVVLARAVAELEQLYRSCRKLLEERAVIIAYKGKMSEIHREMERLKQRLDREKGFRFRVEQVKIPHLEQEERNIVIIETP